jgi:hypothetical protein
LKVYETSKFEKLRKKLGSDREREALKQAVIVVAEDPLTGKKLKRRAQRLPAPQILCGRARAAADL